MNLINPFTQPGKWYKANLHTHTTNSDGKWSPREVAGHYRKHGYQVLALTDHNRTNDVAALTRKGFLVINGAEYGVRRIGGQDTHHLVAINIPRKFAPGSAVRNANALIKAVKAAGGETILAHPCWCKHRYDQFAYLRNLAAMEVFNFGCDDIGRAGSEADWTHMLDAGRVVPAVAVDDAHAYPAQACGGWVWLKLRSLTAGNVIDALRRGCYYSSTGPRIDDFRIQDGRIILRCSPATAVYLILHKPFGGSAHHARGGPIRSLDVQLSPDWQVFRAVVIDSAGRRAWTNPLIFSGKGSLGEFLAGMKASWRTPYRVCASVPARQWEMLDMAPLANRPLHGKDAWIGDGSQLTQIGPGVRRIHGVPFRILDQRRNNGRAAIAVRSRILRTSGGKPLPGSVRIPVNRLCRGIYILHGAGYVAQPGKIAEYAFVYADRSVATKAVWAYGRPGASRREEIKARKNSVVQDWWPAYPQFDNENARRVIVADRKRPLDYRVLYTMQWLNPHPDKVLKEIRMRSVPAASSALLLLAATARI
ncbi:MAG: CehA/McbA family metallohydrolase [Planctomycetes bacterium]|nr:CehA/McbA family metallohydrolase [Planctomycetota bacterium]